MLQLRTPLPSFIGPLPAARLSTDIIHIVWITKGNAAKTWDFTAKTEAFFTFAHQLDLSPFWPTDISLRYLAKTSVYQDIEVLAETCIAKAPHECIVIYVIQGFPYFLPPLVVYGQSRDTV